MQNKRKIINDPVHGFISIPSELIFDLMEHPIVQRLRRIKQLGLSHLVYPGAVHTRFIHALGAMHLITKALTVLRNKGIPVSEKELESAQIAILLHDIGHGPFSHALEHSIVDSLTHEKLSLILMERLNKEFDHKLNLAIDMFLGHYKRKFFHQLIAGEVDVDRLDYLQRDSLFSGVVEGMVGLERIIMMFNVDNEELVLEEKALYSIEKFLIARRFMYWQVYLHKAVLAAEYMLMLCLKRASYLSSSGHDIAGGNALSYFLKKKIGEEEMKNDATALKHFISLDDNDIVTSIKQWQYHSDMVLSFLAKCLLQRKLFKIEITNTQFNTADFEAIEKACERQFSISKEESRFLYYSTKIINNAYDPDEEMIKIKTSSGMTKSLQDVSDLLYAKISEGKGTKYFLLYPKQITP